MKVLVQDTRTETYLRVASLAIALYDYLITLPAEWRFYQSQSSVLRLSVACILFVLIRYTSILVLIISNYGFFAYTFTQASCHRFYLAAPICKVIQTMVSQAILGVRIYNIARRQSFVKWTMVGLFAVVTVLEWFTNLYQRIPIVTNGNCTPGNSSAHLSVWLYYVLAMLYDMVTLGMSFYFLYHLNTRSQRISRLIRAMLYDGLGFFAVLTASNIFNLILYRTSTESLQSSGASLGYAVTWICSQRLLIHLQDIASEGDQRQLESVVMSRQLNTPRDVTNALRSQFDKKSQALDGMQTGRGTPDTDFDRDVELDVQVHVEQSVTVDYQNGSFNRKHERSQGFVWDSRP